MSSCVYIITLFFDLKQGKLKDTNALNRSRKSKDRRKKKVNRTNSHLHHTTHTTRYRPTRTPLNVVDELPVRHILA